MHYILRTEIYHYVDLAMLFINPNYDLKEISPENFSYDIIKAYWNIYTEIMWN